MTTWCNDPALRAANCEAEDVFVYQLVAVLDSELASADRELPRRTAHRLHAFAQAVLDRAAERGLVPASLPLWDLSRTAYEAGLDNAVARLAFVRMRARQPCVRGATRDDPAQAVARALASAARSEQAA